MTEKQLIKNLNNLGSSFREQAVLKKEQSKGLENLIISEIENRTPDSQQGVPVWLKLADMVVPESLVLKPVASFSLAMGLFLILSFATINASADALPGNPLYNIKIGAEKARYVMAFSDEQRAKMSMEIAKMRAKEFRTLINRIDSDQTNSNQLTAQQVSVQIKSELVNIKDKLVKIKDNQEDAKKTVAFAKEVDQTLNDIEQEIEQGESTLELENNVKDVLAEADDISWVVLALLVEKHESGEVDLSADDLDLKLEQEIDKVSTGAEEMALENKEIDEQELLQVKETVAEAEELLEQEILSEAVAKVKEAKDFLKEAAVPVSQNEQVGDPEEVVEGATEEADKEEVILPKATPTKEIIIKEDKPEEWLLDSERQEERVQEFEVEIVN